MKILRFLLFFSILVTYSFLSYGSTRQRIPGLLLETRSYAISSDGSLYLELPFVTSLLAELDQRVSLSQDLKKYRVFLNMYLNSLKSGSWLKALSRGQQNDQIGKMKRIARDRFFLPSDYMITEAELNLIAKCTLLKNLNDETASEFGKGYAVRISNIEQALLYKLFIYRVYDRNIRHFEKLYSKQIQKIRKASAKLPKFDDFQKQALIFWDVFSRKNHSQQKDFTEKVMKRHHSAAQGISTLYFILDRVFIEFFDQISLLEGRPSDGFHTRFADTLKMDHYKQIRSLEKNFSAMNRICIDSARTKAGNARRDRMKKNAVKKGLNDFNLNMFNEAEKHSRRVFSFLIPKKPQALQDAEDAALIAMLSDSTAASSPRSERKKRTASSQRDQGNLLTELEEAADIGEVESEAAPQLEKTIESRIRDCLAFEKDSSFCEFPRVSRWSRGGLSSLDEDMKGDHGNDTDEEFRSNIYRHFLGSGLMSLVADRELLKLYGYEIEDREGRLGFSFSGLMYRKQVGSSQLELIYDGTYKLGYRYIEGKPHFYHSFLEKPQPRKVSHKGNKKAKRGKKPSRKKPAKAKNSTDSVLWRELIVTQPPYDDSWILVSSKKYLNTLPEFSFDEKSETLIFSKGDGEGGTVYLLVSKIPKI